MKKNVYVIYDKVAEEAVSTLMTSNNDQFLIRDLSSGQLPKTMQEHSEDFDLIKLGVFDSQKCAFIEAYPDGKFVCHLSALVGKKETSNGGE